MSGRGLRIGVMGVGSVGGYVGGKLLAAREVDVVLVGRERTGDELRAHGLTVRDFDGAGEHVPAERIAFHTDASALAECDAVLCCVKSAQSEEVARAMAQVLKPGVVVASLQNGVRNAEVLRASLPDQRVVAGIVDFNIVSRGEGVFHRTMSGALIFERGTPGRWPEVLRALAASGLPTQERDDLAPDQWTKLLVNLNNAVSALSGTPTGELLLSPGYRKILAAVIGEAVGVMRRASIHPARLRGVPAWLMPIVLRLPTPVVRLVTRRQVRMDPQARSSMWEDLMRGRLTEVDYLNGEIVRLAESIGMAAPINRRIVELVHEAERAKSGSPQLAAQAFWRRLTG